MIIFERKTCVVARIRTTDLQFSLLEICGSNPGYDTGFPLKNFHLYVHLIYNIFNINIKHTECFGFDPRYSMAKGDGALRHTLYQ